MVGPTGLAFDAQTDTLYVASTADNEIFAIHDAAIMRHDRGMGTAIVSDPAELHGPLGLVLAPNGDLIAANGDAANPGGTPNDLVEFNRKGDFVGSFQVDPGAPGAAFGITLSVDNGKLEFVAVNDNANTVEFFTLAIPHNRHNRFGVWANCD